MPHSALVATVRAFHFVVDPVRPDDIYLGTPVNQPISVAGPVFRRNPDPGNYLGVFCSNL